MNKFVKGKKNQYVNGEKHGQWQKLEWYNDHNGDLKQYIQFEGNYVKGLQQGECKWYYYSNGQIAHEATWDNGLIIGTGRSYHLNGQLEWISHFIDGKRNGVCKRYRKNGNLELEIDYVNGLKHGLYQKYHDNKMIAVESFYLNGKLNGPFKSYSPEGQLEYELNYSDGLLNGICKYYYKNGNLKLERQFINWKRNGTTKRYNQKGKLIPF